MPWRPGGYENNSIGYRFLQAVIEAYEHVPLVGSESRRYEGAQSLRDAKLMEPIRA